jgi:hypothetical protein
LTSVKGSPAVQGNQSLHPSIDHPINQSSSITMSDADVNAKLSSIVTLLKAVGVDGGKGGKTLDDDQIQAIIRKLQNAQAEAPQIIAALEAHASRQPEPPQPQYEEEDEEEEDDDDANYPMVGPGCSDDISVVSDLTTPTVVSSLNVADEEHYKETLPPMLVGSMLIAPTKRKNLVNNPRTNVRKSGVGGAAAQRRKHYNATMENLRPIRWHRHPRRHPDPPSHNLRQHRNSNRRVPNLSSLRTRPPGEPAWEPRTTITPLPAHGMHSKARQQREAVHPP